MGTASSVDDAIAKSEALGDYRGRRVTSTSIAIRNAGDGLSQAMEIAPEIYEPGDTVYVLLECTVDKHTHALIEKGDSYELKQVFKAGTATVVDDQGSKKKIAQQANKVARAKEEAKGVTRLEGVEDAIDGKDEPAVRPVPDWSDDNEGEQPDGDEET